jgi:hypothetical protein
VLVVRAETLVGRPSREVLAEVGHVFEFLRMDKPEDWSPFFRELDRLENQPAAQPPQVNATPPIHTALLRPVKLAHWVHTDAPSEDLLCCSGLTSI